MSRMRSGRRSIHSQDHLEVKQEHGFEWVAEGRECPRSGGRESRILLPAPLRQSYARAKHGSIEVILQYFQSLGRPAVCLESYQWRRSMMALPRETGCAKGDCIRGSRSLGPLKKLAMLQMRYMIKVTHLRLVLTKDELSKIN